MSPRKTGGKRARKGPAGPKAADDQAWSLTATFDGESAKGAWTMKAEPAAVRTVLQRAVEYLEDSERFRRHSSQALRATADLDVSFGLSDERNRETSRVDFEIAEMLAAVLVELRAKSVRP